MNNTNTCKWCGYGWMGRIEKPKACPACKRYRREKESDVPVLAAERKNPRSSEPERVERLGGRTGGSIPPTGAKPVQRELTENEKALKRMLQPDQFQKMMEQKHGGAE